MGSGYDSDVDYISDSELGRRERRARDYERQLFHTKRKYGKNSEEYKANKEQIGNMRRRGY